MNHVRKNLFWFSSWFADMKMSVIPTSTSTSSSASSAADIPNSPSFQPRQNPFDRLPDDYDEAPLVIESKESVENDSINPRDNMDIPQLLSDGLLAHLLPSLQSNEDNVNDLVGKQSVVLDVLQRENQRFGLGHHYSFDSKPRAHFLRQLITKEQSVSQVSSIGPGSGTRRDTRTIDEIGTNQSLSRETVGHSTNDGVAARTVVTSEAKSSETADGKTKGRVGERNGQGHGEGSGKKIGRQD